MKLFVYGSLKKGKGANSFLGESKFIGKGTLEGFVLYAVCTWPGIRAGDGVVHGEVYEIDDNQLEYCDRYEGYPNLFGREEVEVSVCSEDGEKTTVTTCWVYVYNGNVDQKKVVDSGIW